MMLKRDKLYRVNKFDVGGQTLVGVSNAFSGTGLTKPTIAPRINWSSGSGMAQGLGQSKALVNSFGSTARQNNLFAGTGGSSGTIKGPAARESNGWGNIGSYIGAASGVFDGIAAGANNEYSADAQGNGFGLVDRLLTQGKKNRVGRTFVNTGASLTNAGIQSGNGPLALAGGIVGTVGTIINNGWGYKVDEEKLAAVNDATRRNYAFTSNASNLDDIQRPESTNMDTKVYEGGVLTDDDADRKNALLAKTLRESQLFAQRSVDNNINNLLNDQYQNGLANYSAYGGLIDNGLGNENMGAVGYGFMSDYLNTKRKNADNRNQMNNLFMGSPSSMFAFGGSINTLADGGQTSPARQLAKGWYDGTIGGFVNMGKALVNSARKALRKDAPVFGGGSFNGAGYSLRWNPAYTPNSNDNFNEAFDEARNAGAETFKFGDKIYSTVKEANPIREFNNRHVGAGRTEESVRNRKGYGRDFGPLTGKYSLLPIIPYAFGGDMQSNSADFSTGLVHNYSVGKTYDISEEEANRLKAMGYEFTVVS